MAAAGSFAKELSDETICPVCLEYFTDPVITNCGHNFCRACLTQSWGELGRKSSCPECREPIQQCNVRPNRKLASIVEISKKFSLQVAKGTGGACKRHQEPLRLFCRDHEAPICVVCDRSEEHREHRVIPVEEAAEEYKENVQVKLQSLEGGREKLVEWKVAEEQRILECLKQIEEEKQEIKSVFKEMHKFLEEKEQYWLTELVDLEEDIKRMQGSTDLSEEISHLSDLIKEVEEKCQQPPSEFLQDIRCTLSRCQEGEARQKEVLSLQFEWRFRSASLKTSILKKAMEELEESLKQGLSQESLKQALKIVSVTLDPGTAHPYLDLSKDLKSADWGGPYQHLPENPGRFDCNFHVLGQETFTSGRHCWEVEVDIEVLRWFRGDPWAVGVASDTIRRKEQIGLNPDKGIWAVGMDPFYPNAVWAYTSPEWTLLTLSYDLRKIRVFLDYEKGHVEFFFADTDNLLFTFPPASFSGEGIRPFFQLFPRISMQC
ncbi:zinc finger protein RFP-like [Tiliqua scincoides]|uniref:zinc finger protein RFP-like n=1 Tax=Tiliqua scincoides TaxID=71010 RepID=UPI0034631DC5